jgi:AcrR family transcriptional regulator
LETFKLKFVSNVSTTYFCATIKKGSRFTENMTETKLGIQQKAQNLFFKYGIKSVTMDDIARELTISKKTLYQFFENKTDILQSIAHANKARDIEMIGAIVKKSKDAIDEMLHIAKYVTNELSQITSQTALYDMQKYYPEIWIQYMEFQQEFIYEQIKKNVTDPILTLILSQNYTSARRIASLMKICFHRKNTTK